MIQTTPAPDLLGPLPDLMAAAPGPVVRVTTPAGDPMWLVRDHALGRSVLADRRFSRAATLAPGAPRFNDAQPAPEAMMSMDGAEHARLRRIVSGAFTTGRVAALGPDIQDQVAGYLDAIEAAGPGADLIEGLAAPLPLAVLCALLGVPPEDGPRFRGWVEVLFDISASSPHEKGRRRLELVDYFAGLVAAKQRRPGPDLLSTLIGVQSDGGLSMAELVTLGLTLLMAGYETTIGQIGLAALTVLCDPATAARLRAEPAGLPTAVEELLRLNPATPLSFPRVALEPVELAGTVIQAGEAVLVSLLDGNHDAAAYAEPSAVAVLGHDAPHLSFGHGVHRCLGAPLARLQVRIALEGLLSRFPALRLASVPDAVVWKDGLATRGLSRLLVDF